MGDLTAYWSSKAAVEGLIGLLFSAVEELDQHVLAIRYVAMNLLWKSLLEITAQCISIGTSDRITTIIHLHCQKTQQKSLFVALEVPLTGRTPFNSHTLSS